MDRGFRHHRMRQPRRGHRLRVATSDGASRANRDSTLLATSAATNVPAAIAAVSHADRGRIVGALIRITGDWALAEDATQDAFATALVPWPVDGVPNNPAAWLTTTARNRAIDRLRSATSERARAKKASIMDSLQSGEQDVQDDRLRLIFTCCHPALPLPGRVALTLRTVAGLTVPEITAAFLVPETTMAHRLVRAGRKIEEAGIPYRCRRQNCWASDSGECLLFSTSCSTRVTARSRETTPPTPPTRWRAPSHHSCRRSPRLARCARSSSCKTRDATLALGRRVSCSRSRNRIDRDRHARRTGCRTRHSRRPAARRLSLPACRTGRSPEACRSYRRVHEPIMGGSCTSPGRTGAGGFGAPARRTRVVMHTGENS